jgi:hypothetical protein
MQRRRFGQERIEAAAGSCWRHDRMRARSINESPDASRPAHIAPSPDGQSIARPADTGVELARAMARGKVSYAREQVEVGRVR